VISSYRHQRRMESFGFYGMEGVAGDGGVTNAGPGLGFRVRKGKRGKHGKGVGVSHGGVVSPYGITARLQEVALGGGEGGAGVSTQGGSSPDLGDVPKHMSSGGGGVRGLDGNGSSSDFGFCSEDDPMEDVAGESLEGHAHDEPSTAAAAVAAGRSPGYSDTFPALVVRQSTTQPAAAAAVGFRSRVGGGATAAAPGGGGFTGWSLVVPGSWVMPCWVNLMYNGKLLSGIPRGYAVLSLM
jgi:hypothetical protein